MPRTPMPSLFSQRHVCAVPHAPIRLQHIKLNGKLHCPPTFHPPAAATTLDMLTSSFQLLQLLQLHLCSPSPPSSSLQALST